MPLHMVKAQIFNGCFGEMIVIKLMMDITRDSWASPRTREQYESTKYIGQGVEPWSTSFTYIGYKLPRKED
jgi:hypothetical protein